MREGGCGSSEGDRTPLLERNEKKRKPSVWLKTEDRAMMQLISRFCVFSYVALSTGFGVGGEVLGHYTSACRVNLLLGGRLCRYALLCIAMLPPLMCVRGGEGGKADGGELAFGRDGASAGATDGAGEREGEVG